MEQRKRANRAVSGLEIRPTARTVPIVFPPANEFPAAPGPRVIPAEAWRTRNTLHLARTLLGKYLVRASDAGVHAQMIVEVEAYDGERDLACHACRGRTPRTDVMYRAGGVWYVYLCYGVHEMLNLVVGPEHWPAALLVRGLERVNGPGRLTQAFGINRALNGMPAAPASGLHLEDRGVRIPASWIQRSARIGVEPSGPVWSRKPWRFYFDPRRLDPDGVCPPRGPKS